MPNGYTLDQAIQQIREVAEKVGHEPSTGDMGGNVGCYVRIFGTWEGAKEIAGVKGYKAPEIPKAIYHRTYKYSLSKEELDQERKAFEERCKRRKEQEAKHERRQYNFNPSMGRGLARRLKEDEYVPSRAAIEVALGR